MARHGLPDPVEIVLERGFEKAGIEYRRADDGQRHLDFYLPGLNIYVEVKQFHTPRVADQMARVPDIIVIQGMKAVVTFVKMIGGYVPRKNLRPQPLYHDIVEWNCANITHASSRNDAIEQVTPQEDK